MKTAPNKPLKPRFNRQPILRYTSQKNAFLRPSSQLYKFYTPRMYIFYTVVVRVRRTCSKFNRFLTDV